MEIKDNALARQFETSTSAGLMTIEYSFQEKKIFLTKINAPEAVQNEEYLSEMLKKIMELTVEKRLRIVPIHPKIVGFFKKNPVYKELLPPGIRI
jgi:hypothetical protein